MTVIVCVDDQYGMTFNHRRQSSDRIVTQHILQESDNKVLFMGEYSKPLFAGTDPQRVLAMPDFLERAALGDCCFVENVPLSPYEEKIEQIVLYRWNRRYPADFFFDIPLADQGWKRTESSDFPGNSHEKITREVYRK